ncbi:hypothetical protein J6590_058982 [Homalodisca vitripennis]|nr:hypothetical protein J6590_058982 [Homalodisca vitripennis]
MKGRMHSFERETCMSEVKICCQCRSTSVNLRVTVDDQSVSPAGNVGTGITHNTKQRCSVSTADCGLGCRSTSVNLRVTVDDQSVSQAGNVGTGITHNTTQRCSVSTADCGLRGENNQCGYVCQEQHLLTLWSTEVARVAT